MKILIKNFGRFAFLFIGLGFLPCFLFYAEPDVPLAWIELLLALSPFILPYGLISKFKFCVLKVELDI